MIPKKIQALFEFIDFLDQNKTDYIEKYLPLCSKLDKLDKERAKLDPKRNYVEKQQYDLIQTEIREKFRPITQNIYKPVLSKLKELRIWSGDDVYASIWNNNASAINDFKGSFKSDDVQVVMAYKHKYLCFRRETNSNFLCLQFVISSLDEIFKLLFDFFKDNTENEFESFEAQTIEVTNMNDLVKNLKDTKGKNAKFLIKSESIPGYNEERQNLKYFQQITNEIIMGDKIQVGDITNNSGQIILGKDIKISDSLNGKNETANKITELINLIRQDESIREEEREALASDFYKVKEELYKDTPSKPKIYRLLESTKSILEKVTFSHDVVQAVYWLYDNMNFVFDRL